MTANELADKFNRLQGEIILGFLSDCATMLRKQQAEIEKLGSKLNRIVELYTDKAIENEALHKLVKEQDMKIINLSFDVAYANRTDEFRELTDEQMLEVYKKVFNKQNEFKENLKRRSYFDFARAILKKASEK